MLNDCGKELLRPWLSAQNIVLGLAIFFVACLVIKHVELSSDEWASWVQAIGSIAAIAAAIWISSSQRRVQIEAEKLRVELELEMIKTLAQRAVRVVPFESTKSVNLESSKNIIIGLRFSFEAINLVYLQKSSLIEPICTIRDSLRAIEAGMAKSELSGQLVGYVSSTEFRVWVTLLKASSIAITDSLGSRQA